MKFITQHFLLIAIACSVVALMEPRIFTWVLPYIPYLLGFIMFGMGMTISFRHFLIIFKKPQLILLGTLMQYTLMPLIAWLLSWSFHLPKELMIGVILVGACPGGAASNVIVYLARGNVALSVLITTTSTLLSPFVTPTLLYFILHEKVDIDPYAMMHTIATIVLLPVFMGLVVKQVFKKGANKIERHLPGLSVLAIVLIIACVIGLKADYLLTFPLAIFAVVVLHNLLGLLAGYSIANFLGIRHRDAKTLAIEVGMQNSGLGVALANQFFPYSLAALPGAIFSLWHNLSGIVAARTWSKIHTHYKKKERSKLFPKV